jgi:hypothetical protein
MPTVLDQYLLISKGIKRTKQIKKALNHKVFFSPADKGICRRIGSTTRLQVLELVLEAVGCTTAGNYQCWHRRSHWYHFWISGPSGGMARLAFHRLSWTMAAPIYVPFTILLIGNSISWAPPFLSICSTTPSRLRIGIARETKMERAPTHCTNSKIKTPIKWKGLRKKTNQTKGRKKKKMNSASKTASLYS